MGFHRGNCAAAMAVGPAGPLQTLEWHREIPSAAVRANTDHEWLFAVRKANSKRLGLANVERHRNGNRKPLLVTSAEMPRWQEKAPGLRGRRWERYGDGGWGGGSCPIYRLVLGGLGFANIR